LTELYPPFEHDVDLLLRIDKADSRMSHAHYRAYDERDLRRTDEMTRGGGGLSIMKNMKLPAWAGNIVASYHGGRR
jgi:hypothetical protein